MKVFGCKRNGKYSGGIILVAAKNLEEAFDVYANDEKYAALLYDDAYPKERWSEFTELECYSTIPRPHVIVENSYSE